MALSENQQQVVDEWFVDADVVADMSWGLVDTVVLHLRSDQGEFIVKAAGPSNGHITREITAHEEWTEPWVRTGRVNRLLHTRRDLNMIALSYLPGELVQGSSGADDAETYRQAGGASVAAPEWGSHPNELWLLLRNPAARSGVGTFAGQRTAGDAMVEVA